MTDISQYNEDVQEFFQRGKESNQKYTIVMEDTFDYEDYPYYSNDLDDCFGYIEANNGHNMQRFLTLFDLNTGEKLRGF